MQTESHNETNVLFPFYFSKFT